MEFVIYKNRPIPPRTGPGNIHGAKCKYPWSSMEVGDCFAAYCTTAGIASLIRYQQKKTGHQYTRRRIDGKEWVWRIK